MAGTQLRLAGTTATYAPVIKRGVATLTDGRTVSLFIDTNQAGTGGTDVTGVAKMHFYVSSDASRTVFALALSHTPAAAPASTTRAAVASMTAASDNSIWVAWQGVDNGLYVSRFSYTAGAVAHVATETVVAASAVTNKFRAIDIDLAGTNTAAVMVYEANDSTGNSAFHRVYMRNTSNNWVRCLNLTALSSGQFIRANSEDVSIAWRQDGITANIGRFVIYGTKTHTTGDLGDVIRLYQVNNTAATTDTATLVGTWYTNYNQNQAAGTRRAMMFSISATAWIMGGVVGAGVPKFFGVKLSNAVQSPFGTVNTAGYVSSSALSQFFKVDTSANLRTYWTVSYKDNRMIFAFNGVGSGSNALIAREVSMSWADVNSVNAKSTIDVIPRPLDSAHNWNGGPIGIYGGDNRRTQAGLKTYNFTAWYGPYGNTVSTTLTRAVRFVSEDTFDAPALLSPYSTEPTNRPMYRVRVENVNLQPNLYGKVEITVASNNTFTTNVKNIIQADSELRYFGSQDGLSGGAVTVTVPTPSALYALFQGTWYWRARLISDKDTPGAWSGTNTFTVSHAPVAAPIFPSPASVVPNDTGDSYNFSWLRSDTEPTDTQTAYRLVVRRLDTMATILDTGFVVSSLTNATVTIDADGGSLLEVPLDWSVQLRDADAVTGAATVPTEFAIGTPPGLTVVTPAPAPPIETALPTTSWNFTGFGTRTQKAYRVAFYRNSTPNLLFDPGFESGSISPAWAASGAASVAISTVQEHGGVWSAFVTPSGSSAFSGVVGAGANVIEITAGKQYTATAWVRPTTGNKPVACRIRWYSDDNTYLAESIASLTAIAATWQQVSVTAEAPAGASRAIIGGGLITTPAGTDTCYVDDLVLSLATVDSSDYIHDSFWRASTATSYTPPSQILTDLSSYGVLVQVQDTAGLVTQQTVLFTTDWVDPVAITGVTVTPDAQKVRVQWSNALQDPDWVSYRVYRRYMESNTTDLDVNESLSTWYLVAETDAVQTNYIFDDYTAPFNKNIDYVVVQVVDRFGSLIESSVAGYQSTEQEGSNYCFIPQVQLGTMAVFAASGVTGDTFSRDVEQETLHVVGRGRQVQVGDDLGYSGTLTIRSRNSDLVRTQRELLETISALYNSVYMKTPFGDVFLVALGNVQSSRVPGYGGPIDFVDITVPYTQIIDESRIARQL